MGENIEVGVIIVLAGIAPATTSEAGRNSGALSSIPIEPVSVRYDLMEEVALLFRRQQPHFLELWQWA